MAEHDDALRRHGFHPLAVKAVVEETADTRSLVLDVPADLRDLFSYEPGQYCSFRIHKGEDEQARCYSMSSTPGIDEDLTVTVKRVPGGIVSNWLNDNVSAGDVLEVTAPAGTFVLREGTRPVIGFCGGSGVTPVISIAKSVLGSSGRPFRMLYANRDADSVIFDETLRALAAQYGERLDLRLHLDDEGGYLDAAAITTFVDDTLDADFYICGPGPFMDIVESTLLSLGVPAASIGIERFITPGDIGAAVPAVAVAVADGSMASETEQVTIVLKRRKTVIDYRAGDTILETARRAALSAPYSCEGGSCATCMALVKDGAVTMRANFALTDDEIEEGWVLTCQAIPTTTTVTIEYEHL